MPSVCEDLREGVLRLCAFSQPPNSAWVLGCSLRARGLSAWPCQQWLAGFLQSFLELHRKRGYVELLLQHLCPRGSSPGADAEDVPGEAGEMRNSCRSRFPFFTPFSSSLLPPLFALHTCYKLALAETDGYRQEMSLYSML